MDFFLNTMQVTFFYPSTELSMAVPFSCKCGDPHCLGTISGSQAWW